MVQVFEIGPDVDWLEPGQWVYVEYGRWTEGFTCKDDRLEDGQKIWKVDPNGCMLISDEEPSNQLNIGNLTSIKPTQYETSKTKTEQVYPLQD